MKLKPFLVHRYQPMRASRNGGRTLKALSMVAFSAKHGAQQAMTPFSFVDRTRSHFAEWLSLQGQWPNSASTERAINMKTNHRRNFKDKKFHIGQRKPSYLICAVGQTCLDGTRVGASATNGDATCGSRGVRRDKAGAKKFVHSRRRRRDRDYLK